jgi:threonine dehydrogenase-like Zn-dependent dehydrogenase
MADDVVARALVLEEPRRLVVREFPLPAVGDDDALVRVEACGLCGTDHEQYTGAVLGPGIRGLCAAAAAKEAGAGFVMVTGLGWRDAERLALASAFGADLAVDVAVDDPVAALRDATGGLADVVVDVTAKAPAAFTQAIELARTAGTVVVAGTRGWGTGAPGFEPDMVVMKELRVLGALGVDALPTVPRSTCWPPNGIRSETCRDGASGSTTPMTCSPRWPASATASRPCTGC